MRQGAPMLSLGRVRKLVGSGNALTEEHLSELRDQLYELARAAVALYGDPRPKSLPASARPSLPLLRLVPPHRLEEVEERAAIREFDGGLFRADAECAAVAALGLLGHE